MRTAVAAAVLTVLFLAPVVEGATISCDDHVNASDLTLSCTLFGERNETVKLYLKSFDGIPVDSDVWATGHVLGLDRAITTNLGGAYFIPPFNFWVNLENAMRIAADRVWLGSSHYWVFYNKENILTFEIIPRNGAVGEKNVMVYISGRVPYPWEDSEVLRFSLEIGLALATVLVLMFLSKLADALRTKRAEELSETSQGEKKLEPPESSRSSFIGSVFLFTVIGNAMAPWVFYFLATPLRVANDMKPYIPMVALIGLTLEWLFFVRQAEKSGHPYVIREAPITGLEWTPLVVMPFGGWPLALGLLLFLLLFLLNQEPEINRWMRKLALPVSLLTAFALILLVNADVLFSVIFLAMAFIHSHLVVSKIESAPRIEELLPTHRSPEVRGLLEKFDRVIHERRLEGRE